MLLTIEIKFTKLMPAAVAALSIAAFPMTSMALPIDIFVGDNDGYGFGLADNTAAPNAVWPGPGGNGTDYDGRSTAEAAATDGTQITDVYSALFPEFGPNTSNSATVILPFAGTLLSGTLQIDMGDFQAPSFGPIAANINGVSLDWSSFNDGFRGTLIRDFVLDGAMITAANAVGQVELNLDRSGSEDFIAFDYFRLSGDTFTGVPEPTTLALLGIGLAGIGFARRRMK